MRRYHIEIQNKSYTIDVEEVDANHFRVVLDNQPYEVALSSAQDLAEAQITPAITPAEPKTPVHIPSVSPAPAVATPTPRADLTAPMPGTIIEILVKPGDQVKRGQTVLVLEAMKMKNAIKSPQDGVIGQVVAEQGKAVRHGDVLVTFEESAR